MTGPEHYQRAEAMLRRADGEYADQAAYTMAKAQVHATLALAAATALYDGATGSTVADCIAWRDAASTKDATPDPARSEAANAHPHPNH